MPAIEIDQTKREQFVRTNQGKGILENCIVHRSQQCRDRGGMYVRPPSNTIVFNSEGYAAGGGAHICTECGALLRGADA